VEKNPSSVNWRHP